MNIDDLPNAKAFQPPGFFHLAGTITINGAIYPVRFQVDASMVNGKIVLGVPGQIPSTATNDNASAGNVGEYLTASLASGSAVALTTITSADIITLALPAGDWDVWAVANYSNGGTGTDLFQQGISIVANTLGADGTYSAFRMPDASAVVLADPTPIVRLPVGIAGVTARLVCNATFAGSLSAYGSIFARRAR